MDTLRLDAHSTDPMVIEYTKLAALAVLKLLFTEPGWWQSVVQMSKDGKGISSAVLTLGGTTVEAGFQAVHSLVVTIAGFGRIDLLANTYQRRVNGEPEIALVLRREIEAARVVIESVILRGYQWLTNGS